MKRYPLLAIALAWFVPGLGHLFLGRPRKALFFFATLTFTYILGYVLADFRFVRYDDNPFYYVGRYGSGLTMLATWLIRDNGPRGISPLEYYEPGLLYMCSAGLLNVVLVLNLLSLKETPSESPQGVGQDATGQAPPLP